MAERCPQCGTETLDDALACPNCGLLLHPDARADEFAARRPSIVEALLSSTAPITQPPTAPPDPREQVTARTTVLMDEHAFPRLVGSLDLALNPLDPFEARIVAYIDGRTSVPALATAASVALVEVRAVMRSLLERRVIEIHRHEPPPLRPRTTGTHPAPGKKTGHVPAPSLKKTSEAPSLADAPPGRTDNVLEKVVALEREGDTERAIMVLTRELGNARRPAPLYNKLALILVNQRRDYQRAEELLEKALELDPRNTVYEQNLERVRGLLISARRGR